MFDEVNGLPIHPLVVHGAVVLVPLAALLGVLFAIPRFRNWARVPLALVSLAAAGSVYVAKESGSKLQEVLAAQGGEGWANSPVAPLIEEHEERGDLLFTLTLMFAAVAVLAWLLSRSVERFTQPVAMVISALLVVGAAALAFQAYRVGEIGAKAVWNPTGDADFSTS
jgi:ABC-type branched-subunit amino acid transport system permease subunit